MPKISPKLAAAVGPPLTAVVTAMILSNTVDRTSLAALAAIAIGAALGYHAPSGATSSVAQGELSRGLALHAKQPPTTIVAPADTGDDGDDHLPGDLATRDNDEAPPPDHIDQPDPNHPEVN